MRILTLHLSVALAMFGGSVAAPAQDIENGRRLSERLCSECHAIGPAPAKSSQVLSFATIAARRGISSDMISSFLLLPHATMPNLPLSRKDAQDIAAFILEPKK